MKYYAVTDDPNELMHYGVLGMHWGVTHDKPRHTGSGKRRSAAYKSAKAKLDASMRNGIAKVQTKWKTYNSPQAKEERFMKKAMQQARTGTLKYGKLTDAQVRKVTQRLALERDARSLGGTENPKYSKRIKMAIGEGIVRGIGAGTGAYIEERFRGRGRTTADIKRDKRMAKYESNERVMRRKAKNEAKREYYEEQAKEGNLHSKAGSVIRLIGMDIADPRRDTFKEERKFYRQNLTTKGQAKIMAAKRESDKEEERKKRQEEARDRSYYTSLGKLQAERDMGSKLPEPKKSTSNSSKPTAVIRRTTYHVQTRYQSNNPIATRRNPYQRSRNGRN